MGKSIPFKAGLLVFISTLIATGAVEVMLRLLDYNYHPMNVKVHGTTTDWRFYHSFDDHHFVYDPQLIWRPRTDYSVFNSQGYRGKELSKAKTSGEFRIVAIGDSNTVGWDGEGAPNWPMYLEQIFEKEGKDIAVVNAGVVGYSSYQGLHRFRESLALQPDMVLVSFGGNDAHKVVVSDAQFNKTAFSSVKPLLYRFKVGQLAIAVWNKIIMADHQAENAELVFRVSPDEYKSNLRKMMKTCKERGMLCVFLTRPFIGESPYELWWKNFAPSYRAATLDLVGEKDVPVVDVYKYFEGKEEYFLDESHFNAAGHQLAARFIYDEIASLVD